MARTKTTRTVQTASEIKGLKIKSTNPKIMSEQIQQLNKMIKSVDQAEEIVYDNTTSHLTATDVQSAIDEVVTDLNDGLSDKLNNYSLVADLTPEENETFGAILQRLRSGYFSDLEADVIDNGYIVLDMGDRTGLIFRCSLDAGEGVTSWDSKFITGTQIELYSLIFGSGTNTTVRKVVITSTPAVTITNMTSEEVSGHVKFYASI